MRLRLFFSRPIALVKRSGWLLKAGITATLLFAIVFTWYFGLQHGLVDAQSKLFLQISDLKIQKALFDEVLDEYKTLRAKFGDLSDYKQAAGNPVSCCQVVMDQARLAGMHLQSYTFKKIKENVRQLIFNFVANYSELLAFLDQLDQSGCVGSCQKLKITKGSHRLQIAYVCGIHTFVK